LIISMLFLAVSRFVCLAVEGRVREVGRRTTWSRRVMVGLTSWTTVRLCVGRVTVRPSDAELLGGEDGDTGRPRPGPGYKGVL